MCLSTGIRLCVGGRVGGGRVVRLGKCGCHQRSEI